MLAHGIAETFLELNEQRLDATDPKLAGWIIGLSADLTPTDLAGDRLRGSGVNFVAGVIGVSRNPEGTPTRPTEGDHRDFGHGSRRERVRGDPVLLGVDQQIRRQRLLRLGA